MPRAIRPRADHHHLSPLPMEGGNLGGARGQHIVVERDAGAKQRRAGRRPRLQKTAAELDDDPPGPRQLASLG